MSEAHLTAVAHRLSMNKPASRSSVLFENAGGTCNFLSGLPSGRLSNCTATCSSGVHFSSRSGNLSLSPSFFALFGKSSFTMRSNLTHHKISRILCQQKFVIFVPDRTFSLKDMSRRSHICVSSSQRALNFRFVFQQVENHVSYTHTVVRHLRRLKVSSVPSKNGTDEVSNDGNEQESPANSLKFIHKVTLDVLAPPDFVWKLWTDIKSAPLWMRWIDRVDFLDDDGIVDSCQDLPPGLRRLSRWICSTIGFEVMWVARVENVESNPPVRVLKWTTVEGLSSRGEVTFKENDIRGTTVELSISHSLPAALGRVMQSGALRSLVQATLQNDLECFQKYAAEVVNQQPECYIKDRECSMKRRGSLTITTACSQNMSDP